jgi:DNA-directed RNA polymerase subunit alpha
MIPLSRPPKLIEKKGNSAVFEIDALYPGYGVTVGNSLRRVLLSSLSGAAVTQMKIKGVSHEFSTLPGVLEDTILIMLNLKQLRFKVFTNEPQKAVLKVKGEKEAKGSDFDFPPQVELVNKNAHVATLTSKSAELEIEIQIEKGVGYSSRDERGKEKLEVGVIPLDAIYTPTKRVSFRIENMRVGERTDFDRLFLDIETDGTLSPEEALFQASEILVNHFSLLADAFRPKAAPKPAVKEKPVKAKKAKKAKKGKKTKARSSGKRAAKKKKK